MVTIFVLPTTEGTEYQRLDDGAIRLNSRFHTDRIPARDSLRVLRALCGSKCDLCFASGGP